MKRKNERIPDFDEIIFKDRNKEYGAYRIRKSYSSTMGISLLAGLALAVALVVLPSLTVPKGSALPPTMVTVDPVDPQLIDPIKIEPLKPEFPPEELPNPNKYLPPEIVNDTTTITNPLAPTDVLTDNARDGAAVDKPTFTETDEPIIPPEPTKYLIVQEMPQFPGGDEALLKYIADNVVYPVEALENRVQGRITVRFVVAPTGAVEEVTVLTSKGTAADLSVLENEAIRVIRTLPIWRPGKQDGIPVHVYYTVPVTFAIR